MKKVELHLHLDGSVRYSDISKLSNLSVEECIEKMNAKNSKDLNEYLSKFDFILNYMQTKENITFLTKGLIEDLIKDDIIYAEIRFAPILHTKEGLSLEDVVKAVLAGLNDKIHVNLILCMMRGFSYEDNLKIIDLYLKNIDKRVVGLDLAGAEALYPNDLYKDLFKIINDNNIPFTIHSGEDLGYESVLKALEFEAKRIGHGINSIYNKDAIKELIDKKVLLEICPTSNVDTFCVKDYSHHPIYELYKLGVLINISTDDRSVSNITLEEEYQKLIKNFNFTKQDLIKINVDSLKNSFIDKEFIDDLIKEIRNS